MLNESHGLCEEATFWVLPKPFIFHAYNYYSPAIHNKQIRHKTKTASMSIYDVLRKAKMTTEKRLMIDLQSVNN